MVNTVLANALLVLALVISSCADIDQLLSEQRQETSQGVESNASCNCRQGRCDCCTNRLASLIGQRLCVNVTYEPDEFQFAYKLLINDRLLYQTRMSGKNPSPACLPIAFLTRLRLCVQFSNVYMIGRNMHACLDLTAAWRTFKLLNVSFDCFRVGTSGLAIVKPEDGGGIPQLQFGANPAQEDLDYDDSAK